ncbi:MAG: SDR family NAD(P)-dependent oxidoreductase [Ilumatobacteraceae bacterium]
MIDGSTTEHPEGTQVAGGRSTERAGASAWWRVRPLLQFLADAACWVVALPVVKTLHYAGVHKVPTAQVAIMVGLAVAFQLAIGLSLHLYRGRYKYGSLEELLVLTATVCFTVAAVTLYLAVAGDEVMRRAVPFLAGTFALDLMVAGRTLRRMSLRRRLHTVDDRRLLVVGAGDAASSIVRVLLDAPPGSYRPVALVDDDPSKSNYRIQGVRVEGTIADLPAVIRKVRPDAVLFAIPSRMAEHIRVVNDMCREADLPLYMLPRVADMFTQPMASDIRPVSEDDLLGRDAADIDYAAVAQYIQGRRVLVTGAGGSIGSELCRQLAQLGPARLVMLDRDESALAAVQLSIEGRTTLDSDSLVLADIRDADRVNEVFRHHRPQVVFHAAALKHLAMLEQAPGEAWKTNVFGTHHVLAAAAEVGTDHFVNISTDKAANPISVLGLSKRVTERLTASMAFDATATGKYVSVRFGNVLGSRGSVLTIFSEQVARGGPITVTHPDVTRFFMTVQEAVRLTIYAGAIGSSGEVLVLDMGEPVRILDVATRFARQRVPSIPIEFTSLRKGEKLHEELFADGEDDTRMVHPLVSHVQAAPLTIATVSDMFERPRLSMRDRLEQLVSLGMPVREPLEW